MDTVYKVLIAIFTFLITSALTYLAKKRQLYVVVQTQFKQTAVSASGVLSQIFVHNRGNNVEEDISVIVDPALKIELLASDTANLSLTDNTIKIDRLHKGKSASALILVENGDFDKTRVVSATSKATDARLIKGPGDVPPNALLTFIVMTLVFSALPLLIGAVNLYEYIADTHRQSQIEKQLSVQFGQGWHALDVYADSELRKSYGGQEFPIEFTRRFKKDGIDTAEFEIYNKTAVPLTVYADVNNKDDKSNDTTYFATVEVPPMSHAPLTVRVPEPAPVSHRPEISFSLKSGDETIWKLFFTLSSSERAATNSQATVLGGQADHVGDTHRQSEVEAQLSVQLGDGWHALDSYATSELRKSYGDQEFPIEYLRRLKKGGVDVAQFEIYNKTALPLKVYADVNNKDNESTDLTYFSSIEVPPMSHAPFNVRVPAPAPVSHKPEISFQLRSGKEFVWRLFFTLPPRSE